MPDHVADVFERMLHKERERRHPSIHEAEWEMRRSQRRFFEEKLEREQRARVAKASLVPPDTLSPEKQLRPKLRWGHGSQPAERGPGAATAAVQPMWQRYAPGLAAGIIVGLLAMMAVRAHDARSRTRVSASVLLLPPSQAAQALPSPPPKPSASPLSASLRPPVSQPSVHAMPSKPPTVTPLKVAPKSATILPATQTETSGASTHPSETPSTRPLRTAIY